MDMKPLEANGELELIKTTPGSYLGYTVTNCPEDLTDAVYPQLFENLRSIISVTSSTSVEMIPWIQ